ncbi:MAG: DEAD/DEAH box helicase family protein [Verrucomicrobiae bacterium]|nr:DEAD/DEAH box helicase family protein [Verrucomicrobiae bacterium]
MTHELKDYQCRALHWLKRYFENCRKLGKAGTAFYETTGEIHEGEGRAYRNVKELPGLPYICLRLPTGGGKTLVACHAIGVANRHLLQAENSLVIWLVPSQAIREQTLKALRNREHPYRQALEAELGSVAVMDIGEALYVTKPALDSQTVIVVATMQAFRREDTEGLKVFQSNGHLMSHFQGVPEEILRDVDRNADGTFDYSLANVFRVRKPVVIVDEAHNARTPLSFGTLARLGPACILELTATPTLTGTEDNPASNVLYSVSAAELKAEHMIKLPVKLKTRPEWKELLGEAIGIRNGLEKAAEREKAATGEYIRPIMLLQAQPKSATRQTLTVEVVEKCLLEDFKIPEKQIVRATGEDRGLDGVDLSKADCPIRYVITVQALKEGWDCPFAYVLCSVAELHAATAVEQILGRVLRLPKASKKTEADLNYAYAFTASANFAASAKALTDGLVANGFEKQEARDLIAPLAEADLDRFELGELGAKTVAEKVTAKPAKEIPVELAAKVEFDAASDTVKILGTLNADEEAQLKECFDKPEAKTEIAAAVQRVRVKVEAAKSPSERGEPFRVPVLAVKQGDFLEQFEQTHLDDFGWTLKGCDAALAEAEFTLAADVPQTGEVDISESGKLEARFMPELEKQMTLLSVDSAWPLARLVNWLDRSFSHHDLTPQETGVFITALVTHLTDARKLTLEQLTANRYKLSRAVERKIAAHRAAAQKKVYDEFLSPGFATPLVVAKDTEFQFPPDAYPASELYRGGYKFKKHYFPVIGDLKSDGEEFDCAVFLDGLPEVKFWVRNLPGPGRETSSFWLQTSTDKFYPDFVCLLTDGRILVVEYKNEKDWSNDDNKEKRALGELWQERSNGACVFHMPKGSKDVATVREKVEPA